MDAVTRQRRVYAPRTTRGFTIVELLIVIVAIAVLAAISIVAYNGVQQRTRTSVRYSDAKSIIKALELYKADKGAYPPSGATATSSCPGHTNGYSYSTATDGKWLDSLISGGYVAAAPLAPNNSCTSYYRYIRYDATSHGCTTRTKNYYVLEIVGVEKAVTPSGASDPANGSHWKPCPETSIGWGTLSDDSWVFTNDE